MDSVPPDGRPTVTYLWGAGTSLALGSPHRPSRSSPLECRYDLAVKHSPDLVNIPLRRPNQGPKQGQGGGSKQRGAGSGVDYEDDGGLGSGLDAL